MGEIKTKPHQRTRSKNKTAKLIELQEAMELLRKENMMLQKENEMLNGMANEIVEHNSENFGTLMSTDFEFDSDLKAIKDDITKGRDEMEKPKFSTKMTNGW